MEALYEKVLFCEWIRLQKLGKSQNKERNEQIFRWKKEEITSVKTENMMDKKEISEKR